MIISGNSLYPQPSDHYRSSAQEVDQRIWHHAFITDERNLLFYSPDTDIYNIGLGLLDQLPNKHIVIQINVPHKDEKYLDLNELLQKFKDDTDLACLPTRYCKLQDIANYKILQTAFIASGCDYISYFSGHGKATVLAIFYQHADFITGSEHEGTLADTDSHSMKMGFMALLRFIGTCYFKKYLSGFVSGGAATPNQLYYPFTGDKPKQWWNAVRSTCNERILTEEERPPTYTALYNHWARTCWVSQMWNNSILEDPYSPLPNAEECGWLKDEDGTYKFNWESNEVARQVTDIIQFLTKGCGCKSGCMSKRCGCVKKDSRCGPGCDCIGCNNIDGSKPTMTYWK